MKTNVEKKHSLRRPGFEPRTFYVSIRQLPDWATVTCGELSAVKIYIIIAVTSCQQSILGGGLVIDPQWRTVCQWKSSRLEFFNWSKIKRTAKVVNLFNCAHLVPERSFMSNFKPICALIKNSIGGYTYIHTHTHPNRRSLLLYV